MRKVKAYLARGMSNRMKDDVVKEAAKDRKFFEDAELYVLCPVAEEGVEKVHKKLLSTKQQMDHYWHRDKEMIREADVVIDCTAHMNSEGTKHEIAFARYHLWKPVIRIFPTGKLPAESSIAFYEDDVVVDSQEEALEWIFRVYGTPWRRFVWKVKLLNRCLPKYLMMRLLWIVR